MKERRSSGRSPIELAASFGIGRDPRPEREARVNNISSSGFCFVSEDKLRVGQEIQVAVDLDTQDQVVVNVKVVWVRKEEGSRRFRVGVELTESDGPDFEKFRQFYKGQI